MDEERAEYITDAMEIIGTGYEHASVTIEPPHATMERRGSEFKEVITPAFVKISTDFKKELAGIDEISLKVWLYIALSVNRYSGKANPGLRTISAGTGLAINTIRAALVRLEDKYNLLTVDRESRKYNIYEPLAFVSANRNEPVSPDDTPAESVSDEPPSVSVQAESVSAKVILNQRNQREPEGTAEVFKTYQSEIGLLTSHTSELIGDLLDNGTPKDWIIEAIHIAVKQNHRSWAYCEAILKRWAVEGKGDKPKHAESAWRTL